MERKKAIEVIKKNWPDSSFTMLREALETLVPELKESEDESIRKDCIKYLNWGYQYCPFNEDKMKIEKCVTWLEKQGESYTKRDADDAYSKGVTNTKNEIEKQYEANYQIRKDIATFILNYKGDIKDRAKWIDYLGIKVSFAEKQGEQKPTDKVEQNFKIGDIIINNENGAISKVNKVLYYDYELISFETGKYYILDQTLTKGNSKLWTIQDAKDGDVLVGGEQLFLFKRMNTPNSFYAHCNYHFIGYDSLSVYDCSYLIDNIIYPATKEQRDLLFQKIKEGGYVWDVEKKELKKIEQKPAEWEPQTGDTFRKKGTTSPTYHLCNKREDDITFGFVENREVGIAGGEITIFTLKNDYELVERPKSIENVVEKELNKAL